MFTIALSGGIGVGKSSVASLLNRAGAFVCDLDAIAREILAPGSEQVDAVEREWPSVVTKGIVDRAALASIVFHDDEARLTLENITYPAIWARVEEELTREEQRNPEGVAVVDIPLLLGSNIESAYQLNVIVASPLEQRIKRLMKDRSYTLEQCYERISKQPSPHELEEIADIVIDNDGSRELLEAKVGRVIDEVLDPYRLSLLRKVAEVGELRAPFLHELKRAQARLRHHGIETRLLSPHKVQAHAPLDEEQLRNLHYAGFVFDASGRIRCAYPHIDLELTAPRSSAASTSCA